MKETLGQKFDLENNYIMIKDFIRKDQTTINTYVANNIASKHSFCVFLYFHFGSLHIYYFYFPFMSVGGYLGGEMGHFFLSF